MLTKIARGILLGLVVVAGSQGLVSELAPACADPASPQKLQPFPPPPGTAVAPAAPAPEALAAESSGRLAIAKEVVDLGDVVRGEVATAVFELQNTGQGELRILDAHPG